MYRRFFKRMIDITISILVLPVVILVILIVGPIIYLEDKGPIFYNANRIGKGGKLFKMFKLRTMKENSPDIRLADGSTYNGDDDPRVTKVGSILRKTSLDELPQFLNILIGDMSLIGPRPDTPEDLDSYTDEEKIILKVLPGITGLNQAENRNSVDSKTKLQNDIRYVKELSFSLDFKILFLTIKTVLLRKNINRC